MKRLLASVLSTMALASVAPALAFDTQDSMAPMPIAMRTPASDAPTVIDNDIKEQPAQGQQIADASSTAQSNPPAATQGGFPKTGIGGSFEKFGKFAKTLPKRLPPAIISGIGGTPICFVQQTMIATKDGVKDICGDSKFPLFIAPAFCLSVPYAAVSGVIGGPVESLAHGWQYSKDKPFSRQSFSLPSK